MGRKTPLKIQRSAVSLAAKKFMDKKKLYSTGNILRFLLPSLCGLFCFLVPITYEGKRQITVAHLAMGLKAYGHAWWSYIFFVFLGLGALLSSWASLGDPSWAQKHPWLGKICKVGYVELSVRLCGALLVTLGLFEVGFSLLPASLYDREAGVLFTILPALLTNLFFGLLLSPLLLQFGLLELIGGLMEGVMRPLFQLPGRAAVNCITSWVGDGTLGVIMATKEYEKGGYTAKEASTVITCFSAVSITYCVFLLHQMELMPYFGGFYCTVIFSSMVAALLLPRIPPLSYQTHAYIDGRLLEKPNKQVEYVKQDKGGQLLGAALAKAAQQRSFADYMKKVGRNWVTLILAILPSVMTIATLGIFLVEASFMTPILTWLGKPFHVFFDWCDIPGGELASRTIFTGFVDMLIPTTMIKSLAGPAYTITRFIIAALSVTQIVYVSELWPMLFSSRLSFGLKNLFLIFILRTLITLPIIILCAKLFLG